MKTKIGNLSLRQNIKHNQLKKEEEKINTSIGTEDLNWACLDVTAPRALRKEIKSLHKQGSRMSTWPASTSPTEGLALLTCLVSDPVIPRIP